MMSLDGVAVDVDGELAAECGDGALSRIRALIAACLRSKGLTLAQVADVLNISEMHVSRICRSVPEWQLRRSREIIDGAVGELLD